MLNLSNDYWYKRVVRKFVTRNPTPGTGLATITTPTTLADTSPFLVILNQAQPSQKTLLQIDYIRLICTAAGTAGTSLRFDVKTDSGNRYTSGGSALTVYGANYDDGTPSIAVIKAGALVAPAANNARLLSGGYLKTAIPAVGDVYQINFGGQEQPPNAIATQVVYSCGEVVIGPQENFLLHLWLPSQSAASSYEIEIGHHER